MQTLAAVNAMRLAIPGKFWDSQVYAGGLYLFGTDGSLTTFSWKRLVAELPVEPRLRFAADAALLGNRLFYEAGAQSLLRDDAIRKVARSRFSELAKRFGNSFKVKTKAASTRANRLPFPHNDSDIHYHRLFVGGREGVFGTEGDAIRTDKEPTRHSEAPAFDIAAKYKTIAIASGADGLFEARLSPERAGRSVVDQVSDLPCTTCEWAGRDLFAANEDGQSFYAEFSMVHDPLARGTSKRKKFRKLERVVADEHVFGMDHSTKDVTSLAWGAGDKLFRLRAGQLEVVRLREKSRRAKKDQDEPFFNHLTTQAAAIPEGMSAVSARVAPFGSVIELDEALLILPTEGDPILLEGEPVNWRVFPRSVDYVNHLHVIYEDRWEVVAFTHDYFVAQGDKKVGTNVSSGAE